MNVELLTTTRPPWLIRNSQAVDGMLNSIVKSANECAARVCILDGSKMKDLHGMFIEFGRCFEFPEYYGCNSAAWNECLLDLSWFPGSSYIAIVTSAEQLLSEDPQEMNWLMGKLHSICDEWSRPVAVGEPWDRTAVAFHFIFHFEPGKEFLFSAFLPELTLNL